MSSPDGLHQVKGAPYLIGAIMAIVLMWGWYFLEDRTNWRITRLGRVPNEKPIDVAFPIIISLVSPIAALVCWRRAVGIAENGVPVTATVQSVGGSFDGLGDVAFEYEFHGIKLTKKKSISGAISDNLQPGDPLQIVVDKRNPKRILVK